MDLPFNDRQGNDMYNITPLDTSTYKIIDEQNDACYLVTGKDKALLIDTTMGKEPIMPVLSSLTDLPIELVLTHGHVDHIGRSAEFETIWLDPADFELYTRHASPNLNPEDPFNTIGLDMTDISKVQPLTPGQSFDLGDKRILILPLAGHTPGSILLADTGGKRVFTGDAIGSGCGVWLWDHDSSSHSAYRNSLIQALKALEDLGVDESWHFAGGHDHQEYESRVSEFNPLDLEMIRDMIELCEVLLKGEETIREDVDVNNLPTPDKSLKTFYTQHKKAEMLTSEGKIR